MKLFERPKSLCMVTMIKRAHIYALNNIFFLVSSVYIFALRLHSIIIMCVIIKMYSKEENNINIERKHISGNSRHE